MMSEEKMQENLNVFLRSSFFVPHPAPFPVLPG